MNLKKNQEIIQPDYGLPIHFFYSNDGHASHILPHFHDYIEIIYLLSGSIEVTVNGVKHTLLPNDVILFNSNTVHSTSTERSDVTAYVLQISYAFLSNSLNQPENPNIHFHLPLASSEPVSQSQEEKLRELIGLLEKLKNIFWPPTEMMSLRIMSVLYDIMYLLTTNFRTAAFLDDTPNLRQLGNIYKITEYIQTHYRHDMRLTQLAGLLNYSPSYLSRCFKSAMGITISDYITLVRLEHAYMEIISTSNPIMVICEENGFANYNFFNIKFKEKYGCTPKKLRCQTKERGDSKKNRPKAGSFNRD